MDDEEYKKLIDQIDEAMIDLGISPANRMRVFHIIADCQTYGYCIDDKSLRKAAYQAAVRQEP